MTIYHEDIEEDIEMLNSKDYFQVKGWNGMIICNLSNDVTINESMQSWPS